MTSKRRMHAALTVLSLSVFSAIPGKKRCSTLLAASTMLVPLSLLGSEFQPYSTYQVDGWAESVSVCDVNGDGKQDVVLATGAQNPLEPAPGDFSVHIFIQSDGGRLNPPVRVPYSSLAEDERRHTAVATADLDRDGFCDIVVGRRKGLSIIMGRDDLRFSARRIDNVVGGSSGDAIVFIDMDGDGYPDVLTHNETSGDKVYGLAVYYNDRSGGVRAQRYLKTSSEGGVRLSKGDLDGDGRDDVALTWYQGVDDRVEIFLNDGNGWFRPPAYLEMPAQLLELWTSSVGDLDGDGRDDVVVGGNDVAFSAGAVYLFRQQAGGRFGAPVRMQTAPWTDSSNIPDVLLSADVTGDRRDDLLVLRSGGGIGFFENSYSGIRAERAVPGPYVSWSHAHGTATGDVNGDGCADVVTANYNYGLVVWPVTGCRNAVRSNGSQPLPVAAFAGSSAKISASNAVSTRSGRLIPGPWTQSERGDEVQAASPRKRWAGRFALVFLMACGLAWMLRVRVH